MQDGSTTIVPFEDPKATISSRDARLRLAVRVAVQGRYNKTAASTEDDAFTELSSKINDAHVAFETFSTLRKDGPVTRQTAPAADR